MKASSPLLAALFLLLALVAREAGSDGPTRPAPSNQAMAERMRALAAETDPLANIFLNDRRAPIFEARVAEAGDDPVAKIRALFDAGEEWTRAGEPENGIERLEEARRLIAAHPDALSGILPWRVGEALAVAWMRVAEQANCVARHNADSCLLPLRGGGLHDDKEGARRAIEELKALLFASPSPSGHRWLLTIALMAIGDYPGGGPVGAAIPESVFAPETDAIHRFENIATEAGVGAFGLAGGAALDDFDNDGDLDLFVSSWGLTDPIRYYANKGDGTFVDATADAGLAGFPGGLNLVHADYDNDGWLDLLVLRGGWMGEAGLFPNSLLRNQGDGTFVDVTEAAGLLSFHPTQVGAWADFDGDGWLDLFVGNESSPYNPLTGLPDDKLRPHPSELYRNMGDGTFEEVSAEVGVGLSAFVKGAAWGDYDNDGRADLYVSVFGGRNRLYHNLGPDEATGAWRFVEVAYDAGVAQPEGSFATWFFDYDNDGWLDLFAAPFGGLGASSLESVAAEALGQRRPGRGNYARLYRNRGDGTFDDVTLAAGLGGAIAAMGANFGDLDGDGWLDIYLATGEPGLSSLIPNRAFRNVEGKRFEEVTYAAGLGHLQKGHAVAFGDIDNDGDDDLFANMGGAYSGDIAASALFRNPGHGNNSKAFVLQGTEANRSAIGARLAVTTIDSAGAELVVRRVIGTGGSFGASSLRQTVGLGASRWATRVEVAWPNGETQAVPLDSYAQDLIPIIQGNDEAELLISFEGVRFTRGMSESEARTAVLRIAERGFMIEENEPESRPMKFSIHAEGDMGTLLFLYFESGKLERVYATGPY